MAVKHRWTQTSQHLPALCPFSAPLLCDTNDGAQPLPTHCVADGHTVRCCLTWAAHCANSNQGFAKSTGCHSGNKTAADFHHVERKNKYLHHTHAKQHQRLCQHALCDRQSHLLVCIFTKQYCGRECMATRCPHSHQLRASTSRYLPHHQGWSLTHH